MENISIVNMDRSPKIGLKPFLKGFSSFRGNDLNKKIWALLEKIWEIFLGCKFIEI